MRKITALVLSVLMIAASLTLMSSAITFDLEDITKNLHDAPVGTPVSTEAEFLAMEPDGEYYLAADISVNTSYEKSFTGTFDGNGHKVTVSVPMFINLNGANVHRLEIEGAVKTTALAEEYGYKSNASGALAATANGNCIFVRIWNKAEVTPADPDNGLGTFIGGIIGETIGASDFIFSNCHNSGKVSLTVTAGNAASGGIIGLAIKSGDPVKSTQMLGCTNNAEIYAKAAAKTGASGGFIGWVEGADLNSFVTCRNYGKIHGYSKTSTGRIGGFIGYTIATLTTFNNCVNDGPVTADADTAVNVCAAGYVGYNNQTAAKTQVVMSFEGCRNNADVTFTGTAPAAYLGGFVGYTRLACDFTDCINTGDVTADYTGEGSKQYDAGAFVDVLGSSGIDHHSTFKNCVNIGNMISDNYRAGGIVAYVYGTGTSYPVFESCAVICDKITGQYAGGLSAYFNTDGVVVKNCYINVPTIESPADPHKANAFFWDNKCAPKAENISGNVVVTNTKYLMAAGSNWETVAWGDTTPGVEMANAGSIVNIPTEAEIKSGKITYEFNQSAGKTILYQDLKSGEDPNPTNTWKVYEVHLVDGKYVNPAPESSGPTGDAAVYFAFAALISVFGIAFVAKKREN